MKYHMSCIPVDGVLNKAELFPEKGVVATDAVFSEVLIPQEPPFDLRHRSCVGCESDRGEALLVD